MGILCIENRTENWTTALRFSPFFQEERRRCLVRTLAPKSDYESAYTKLELFWKGMRDHLHECSEPDVVKDLARRYRDHFSSAVMDLREVVKEFECSSSSSFGSVSQPHNYNVGNDDDKEKLYNNLLNTEIDIVLETPEFLFIGEAKSEMSFGANGNLVLVHQLIRQYVMATILVDRLAQRDGRYRRKVIPFLVGKDKQDLMRKCQVEFMMRQGWLDERRILTWEKIENIANLEK